MARKIFIVLLLTFPLFFEGGPVLAQLTTGTISGTVQDETHAILPGSTVTVKSVDTGIERVVLTDDAGRYRVSNLALGLYEVTAG
ncbi:MAG: carboxypeptidase regulatory-like domain-containing protein, partial [Acidobacteria bacterium]|nr:carboxypeptidase regulatory-like domain-containing protein [Acidobacteriota bacterium]